MKESAISVAVDLQHRRRGPRPAPSKPEVPTTFCGAWCQVSAVRFIGGGGYHDHSVRGETGDCPGYGRKWPGGVGGGIGPSAGQGTGAGRFAVRVLRPGGRGQRRRRPAACGARCCHLILRSSIGPGCHRLPGTVRSPGLPCSRPGHLVPLRWPGEPAPATVGSSFCVHRPPGGPKPAGRRKEAEAAALSGRPRREVPVVKLWNMRPRGTRRPWALSVPVAAAPAGAG